MPVSKPKQVGDRNPNKKGNNILYRTHYRNEKNRDKNKRRNIYRSNTRYGEKQHRYKRNSRQENSRNLITFKQTNNNHQNHESDRYTSRGFNLDKLLNIERRNYNRN